MASLRWRRGRKLLTKKIISKKPRDCQPIAGFFVGIMNAEKRKLKNMKANYRRLSARFGPETRFEVRPAPPAPFRAIQQTEFERLRDQLLSERLEQAREPGFNSHLRRAANEAAALAWVTPYPLLFFPALFEEKAQTALVQLEKQEQVRRLSQELLSV